MKKTYNLERILKLINEPKRLPYVLNIENETNFINKYKELVLNTKSQHEITECLSEDSIQFVTNLFCHWLKITNSTNLYYVEVERNMGATYEHEEVSGENYLVIFFKESTNKYGKTEECVAELSEEQVNSYLLWLQSEFNILKTMRDIKSKYRPVTEMLNEIKEEKNEDLSDEFYESLDLMKKSILEALNDDLNISNTNVSDEKDTLSAIKDIIDEQSIAEKVESTTKEELRFIWNKSETSLKLPIDITNSFNNNCSLISTLDTKTGWLSQQDRQIQETIYALWVEYIYSNEIFIEKNNSNLNEYTWSSLSDYILDWLRYECNTDPKKIERKIADTLSKIMECGAITQFQFINNNSSFVKAILYIEARATEPQNKGIVINYENIQKQYFYNLDNDQTLTQIWGAIIHDKIKKTRASKTTIEQFEQLKKRFPNFREVIDYYSGAMFIYEQTGTTPAPVLLLGSPGLGKTHFANEIAKIIGSQLTVIPISSLTAGWIISGAAAQWKDAQLGKVATSLLNGSTMSPVIVLDEIDKKSDGNYNPVGALYPLLEHQTAKEFVDEYLEFPIDASNVLWVATANTLNSIDEPILDRFVVFEIKKLSEAETIEVAKTIFNELTNGILGGALDEEVLNSLKDKTPRQIKQILKKGLAYAAVTRNKEITVKKEHLDLITKIKKIGF